MSNCQYPLGLIGRHLGFSFSHHFFNEKFNHLGISDLFSYDNWEFDTPEQAMHFIRSDHFFGANVTSPYKEKAAEACDELVSYAADIYAVNTIKKENGRTIGYNTDVAGFRSMLLEADLYSAIDRTKPAVILGSGGAAKAVQCGLKALEIDSVVVSRHPSEHAISYDDLLAHLPTDYSIVVNATPLGMTHLLDEMPPIHPEFILPNHLVIDLIYNPAQTKFLKTAAQRGAWTMNGEVMLYKQAELSWAIWCDGISLFE